MRLKPDELAQILGRPGYSDTSLAPRLPHPVLKPDVGEDALGKGENEKGCRPRLIVRIERRGAKLLDLDNLYGSVKYVCDALRYAHLIPADDPEAIDLIVTQKKVACPERGTLITIERI